MLIVMVIILIGDYFCRVVVIENMRSVIIRNIERFVFEMVVEVCVGVKICLYVILVLGMEDVLMMGLV